ncbi:MAG: prolipoprotein diacylglyceryl transferase [Acidobacteria bacterium]|nr:prolipoprotein diacylglyceryl transferase [Acidobacteriota bacterium]
MIALLASLPSPGSGSVSLGPLRLNAYGALIALGVVVATWLTGRRFEARGVGTRDDASSIAIWAVPAGVVGGRLYHVATDWQRFSDDPAAILRIWKGGLGVWGGIALGVVVGLMVARRRGIPVGAALTCVAPALAFAQAIGRWGNWFNQELFGRPTTLPWALEVSARTADHAGYAAGTTFHPTFLYESIACALLGAVLLRWDRMRPMRPGRLFAAYVMGYTSFRFFIEGLRIDEAKEAGGLRLNQWTSIVVFAAAVVALVATRNRRPAERAPTEAG